MFDGVIDLVSAKPENGKISININANSTYADDGSLGEQLKISEFT